MHPLWKRWKYSIPIILVLLVVLMVFLISCGLATSAKHYASAKITLQPKGGAYVQSLTCDISTSITVTGDGAFPNVKYTIEWMTSKGKHKTETFVPESEHDSFKTSFSAPEGKYLDKTFWVKISWIDSFSKHSLESDKVSCIVP
jgi:hypothetical protein